MTIGEYIPRCMPFPNLGLYDWGPVERVQYEPAPIRTQVNMKDLDVWKTRFRVYLPYRPTRRLLRRREPPCSTRTRAPHLAEIAALKDVNAEYSALLGTPVGMTLRPASRTRAN